MTGKYTKHASKERMEPASDLDFDFDTIMGYDINQLCGCINCEGGRNL